MEIYTKQLIQCGLTEHQATIYELLIKKGALRASTITRLLEGRLSRPMVYAVLNELSELGLVEKNDVDTKVARFSPAHPSKLQEVGRVRRAEIDASIEAAATLIPRIVSEYNLVSSKPGVQFYEGREGIWEVLMDSLTATEEILTYADLEAIAKHIPDINEKYSADREKKNVKKRGLVIDSPEARKFLSSYDGKVTHTKLIRSDANVIPFQTVMQIYDEKISYITLTDQHFMGVIISNKYIANTHKYLFESLWQLSSGEEV